MSFEQQKLSFESYLKTLILNHVKFQLEKLKLHRLYHTKILLIEAKICIPNSNY